MVSEITDFHTEGTRYLSNFFEAPIDYLGKRWPSSEHAYQAAKFMDEEKREKIRAAKTPGAAKKLGRKMKGVRPDWDCVKIHIMEEIVAEKFLQNPVLASMLMDTGDAILVEGNDWDDRIWGMTRNEDGKWVGENQLGRILMKIRAQLLVTENTADEDRRVYWDTVGPA